MKDKDDIAMYYWLLAKENDFQKAINKLEKHIEEKQVRHQALRDVQVYRDSMLKDLLNKIESY